MLSIPSLRLSSLAYLGVGNGYLDYESTLDRDLIRQELVLQTGCLIGQLHAH